MFLIRYHNGTSYQVLKLHPQPTEVSYPDGLLFSKTDTQDNAVVLQRTLRDPRVRSWIWKAYRQWIPQYESQWTTIQSLNAKIRKDNDLEVEVYVWENDTDEDNQYNQTTDSLDPDLATYTNLTWTKVKFIQTRRKTRGGGGPTTYEDSIIEFVHVG